jgi:uncharacterized repeat protein (TIGR01451 family)
MLRKARFRNSLNAILGAAAIALGLAAGAGLGDTRPADAQTPLPDLAVWVEWSALRVGVGDPLSFKVSVTNDGPPPLGPVPAGAVVRISVTNGTIVSFTQGSSGFTCSPESFGPRDVVCHRDVPMPPGTIVELTVVVQAPSQPGTITATATGSLPTSLPDKNPTNNSSVRSVQVLAVVRPDLAVSIVGLPSSVVGGADVTYRLAVSNVGDGAAANVRVHHRLPLGAAFVSASRPSFWTCTPAQGALTCTTSGLAAHHSATIDVVTRVPMAPGSLVFAAVVDTVQGEQVTANNSASVTVGNLGAPDLKPIVTSRRWLLHDIPRIPLTSWTSGVTLQVNVMNLGPGPAGPTTLRVELPPELAKFVNASDPVNRELLGHRIHWTSEESRDVQGPRLSCSLSPSVVTCSIPQLAGGASTGTTDIFAVLLRKLGGLVGDMNVPVPFTVRADADRVLREHDERNNVVVWIVTFG